MESTATCTVRPATSSGHLKGESGGIFPIGTIPESSKGPRSGSNCGVILMSRLTPSITTKSLPTPCILVNLSRISDLADCLHYTCPSSVPVIPATLPVIAESIPPRLVVAVIAVGRGHDRQICHGEQERRYAACVMLGAIGVAEMHPDARGIVAVHDNETRASSRLPLA